MGFWKSLGKGLLKAAPIAANFIPGIGPLVSMGIQAGLGAANAKVSGGGLKDMLIGAGTGAAMSKLGGKLGGTKGLGPSKGIGATLGNVAKQTGKSILTSPSTMKDIVGGAISGRSLNQSQPALSYAGPSGYGAAERGGVGIDRGMDRFHQEMRRGLGPVMGRSNQNFPNLANSLGAGRLDAIRNQPFRGGYDVQTLGNDGETVINREMPAIYPTNRPAYRKRKKELKDRALAPTTPPVEEPTEETVAQ